MASAELHIKDSYYFEVPKFMWRSDHHKREDFPDFWVRLDAEYQHWEAGHIYAAAKELYGDETPEFESLKHDFEHWKHEDHANFAKPFDRFLFETQDWFSSKFEAKKTIGEGDEKKKLTETEFKKAQQAAKQWRYGWEGQLAKHVDFEAYNGQWDGAKVEGYNRALDGKILVPQPFGGELKNLYEPESGFCVSKFMVIQVVVAFIIVGLFSWLAKKIEWGQAPKGKFANLLETFLVFMRDEVARPAIGKKDADKFVPLLWTIFFFILGCNLMGMIPWIGAPTGAWGFTFAMACVTFATVVVCGSQKFGVVGFWLNQIPSMDLPLILAIFIKPMILVIEILGLFIKHVVLSIRLLANMVAGHLVLLAIMGMAVAAAKDPSWGTTASIAVVGSTLFSCLELFVAFLQAYVFTFLSALFIGAAIHHH